ncbi:hypothetical protein [Actinophytocola sp.]|uniref:hypothetical protein n=1 Tax=Actinophytocola sp. TaxID=1872138 RepID=UPI00389A8ADB
MLHPPLDHVAIDNLPSLLPHEASVDFSAQLTPLLPSSGRTDSAWDKTLSSYQSATMGIICD